MKRAVVACGAVVLALALTGCQENVGDRSAGAGMAADAYADATEVTIWLNADRVPNVALFCADSRAWAATLNSDHGGRGQLVRDPERDDRCAS